MQIEQNKESKAVENIIVWFGAMHKYCRQLGASMSPGRHKSGLDSQSAWANAVCPTAAALTPHAVCPDFLTYPEDMGKSAKNSKKLLLHRKLFCDLHKLRPRLVWSQVEMVSALIRLAGETPHWPRKLVGHELQEFASRMALRLRTAFHDINQARSKKTPAAWVDRLLSGEDDGSPCAPLLPCDASAAADAGSQGQDFLSGFDWERERAWRALSDGRCKIFAEARAEGDKVVATFEGAQMQIDSITTAELAELQAKAGVRTGAGSGSTRIWTGALQDGTQIHVARCRKTKAKLSKPKSKTKS